MSLLSSSIAHPPISQPRDEEKWRPNSDFSVGEHARSGSVNICRPAGGGCIMLTISSTYQRSFVVKLAGVPMTARKEAEQELTD